MQYRVKIVTNYFFLVYPLSPFCAQWATVGLYSPIALSGQTLLPTVHYYFAASVSAFQTFLRPLGAALTEETVRGVVRRERNTVYKDLAKVFSSVATAANKTYQLVSQYQKWSIYLFKHNYIYAGCRSRPMPIYISAACRIFPPI